MADIVDTKTRSRMMSSIKSKNTKPEVSLRSALHRRGFRFKIHDRNLPGKPDIVLPRYRSVILVQGCFWHRHGCRLTSTPATNGEFWLAKFESTIARDKRQGSELQKKGWRSAVVWECAIRDFGAEGVAELLDGWLRGEGLHMSLPGTIEVAPPSIPVALQP